jgi:formylglycine-generating enzyme required for sulfatase activity
VEDDKEVFSEPSILGMNGNGAVSFEKAAEGPGPNTPYNPEDPPPAGTLTIKDGKFEGLDEDDPTNKTAYIGFTSAGYDAGTTAEVYYAVVTANSTTPGYSAYTNSLDPVAQDTHTGKLITLPGDGNNIDYDVYVLLFKGGKVSAPLKINTKKGGQKVEGEFGDDAPMPAYMTLVKGGKFMMGSPADQAEKGRNIDEVQHEVTVSSFYMSKYEVSQAEYKAYTDAIKTTHTNNFTGDNLPVEQVSWYDAVEYCNWLSGVEGLSPAYEITKGDESAQDMWTVNWDKSANGYRLPTEAEWEYACRAVDPDAPTYPPFNTGVNITMEQANFNGTSSYNGQNTGGTYKGKTMAVDSFQKNKFGLYNIHGNVFEWCRDWYDTDYYKAGEASDPDGPPVSNARVVRGGNYLVFAEFLHSAYRTYYNPMSSYYFLGFRLVRPE